MSQQQKAPAPRGSVDGLPRSASQLDTMVSESKTQTSTTTKKTIAATKETSNTKTWGPLTIQSTAKSDITTTIKANLKESTLGSFDSMYGDFELSGCLSLTELNNLLLKYIRTVHELEESMGGGGSKQTKSINISIDDSKIVSLDSKFKKETTSWEDLWSELQKKIAQLKALIAKLEADKANLEKLGKDKDELLAKREKEIKDLLAKLAELKAKLSTYPSQQSFLVSELERLQNSMAPLQGEIDSYKTLTNNEVLRGEDLEAKIRSLEDELRFKINVLEFELERKQEDFSKETNSIEIRIKGEHAARLKIELRMLRNQFEEVMGFKKQKLESIYRAQITKLELELSLAVSQQKSPEDLDTIRLQIKTLESKIVALHGNNQELTKAWSQLTVQIKSQEAEFSAKLNEKERMIFYQKKENERMMRRYEELAAKLMLTKVEVGVYDKLLSPEINRVTTRYSEQNFSKAVESKTVESKKA